MTTTEPTAEPERPRLALFWGATLTALVIGFVATLGGATVKPLLDVPALITQVTAGEQPAPADPGAPFEPGTAAPEPTTPAAASDVCEAPADAFTTRVCASAAALGWTVTAPTSVLREGEPFTALAMTESGALPPLASNQRLLAPSIPGGYAVAWSHERDGLMRAEVTSLPAQSGAALAGEIRTALGAPEVFFFEGGKLADGPSISFGSGWEIATAYDASRAVGAQFKAGWVTLTVERSDPKVGTVYSVN